MGLSEILRGCGRTEWQISTGYSVQGAVPVAGGAGNLNPINLLPPSGVAARANPLPILLRHKTVTILAGFNLTLGSPGVTMHRGLVRPMTGNTIRLT